MGLAPAVGSEILATLLAGKLNDYFRRDGEFVTTDSAGNRTTHCNNSNCYRYVSTSPNDTTTTRSPKPNA
jgi:hypothetical protein